MVCILRVAVTWFVFFFNDTATTEIYTLSLHDALPISRVRPRARPRVGLACYYGRLEVTMTFRFTTAGESHGRGLVGILEGIPAGLPVSAERVNAELKRRMGGYGRGARMKIESDQIEWLAGGRAGRALRSPLPMLVWNPRWEHRQGGIAPQADARGSERARQA